MGHAEQRIEARRDDVPGDQRPQHGVAVVERRVLRILRARLDPARHLGKQGAPVGAGSHCLDVAGSNPGTQAVDAVRVRALPAQGQ